MDSVYIVICQGGAIEAVFRDQDDAKELVNYLTYLDDDCACDDDKYLADYVEWSVT